MRCRGSNHRLSGGGGRILCRSQISTLMLSLLATAASFYVAGRMWQDAQNRVHLIKELDRITGQGKSAISVDDTLKIIACREQRKKLSALEMELISAKQEGFATKYFSETKTLPKKRPLVVIGVHTGFGRKNNRDAIRKAWMGTGAYRVKMEEQKGVIVRFVIGRSASHGDSMDRSIDSENRQTVDFIILEKQIEAAGELSNKTKLFFAYAAQHWNAEFYAKINDDIYVNIDTLGNTLAAHLDKPHVYIGCMKSGEVFSQQGHRWYEPDWWKFGDGKAYFHHASGEMYVVSRALVHHIAMNSAILRAYAHDDVTAGSWFIGLDVKHIDDRKFCCSSWTSGALCSGVMQL